MSRIFLIAVLTIIVQGIPAASIAQATPSPRYAPFGGGWSPTKFSLYFGGQLIEAGTYHHCKADVPLDKGLFNPAKLLRFH